MEGEPYDVVPCSSVAVDSILRIGTAGAIWGLCSAPHEARKQGLGGVAQAAFVVNGLIAGAVAGGAIAAMTRSWTQVVPMACLVSAFKVATDYARTT